MKTYKYTEIAKTKEKLTKNWWITGMTPVERAKWIQYIR